MAAAGAAGGRRGTPGRLSASFTNDQPAWESHSDGSRRSFSHVSFDPAEIASGHMQASMSPRARRSLPVLSVSPQGPAEYSAGPPTQRRASVARLTGDQALTAIAEANPNHLQQIEQQRAEELASRAALQSRTALQHRSLFLFRGSFCVRVFVFDLVHHRIFEGIVILLIFTNCLFLAMEDPTRTSQPQYLEILELFFMAAFALEMCLKVFAMGFIMHPGSYLRNGWNRLDFVIVAMSVLALFPFFGNYSAIRTLRVLRPLRSINGIQGLKNIVNGLLGSMKKLVNVFALTAFLLFIFGILGIQLWAGEFGWRCQEAVWPDGTPCDGAAGCGQADFVPNASIHVDEGWVRYCKRGASHISALKLGAFWGRPCEPGYVCVDTRTNPNAGYTSFDNFLWAFLSIFQCLTMEGWVEIMYIVQDVWGTLGVAYFILLIILGSFLILNLALAVINEEFVRIRKEAEEETWAAIREMQAYLAAELEAEAEAEAAEAAEALHSVGEVMELTVNAPGELFTPVGEEEKARVTDAPLSDRALTVPQQTPRPWTPVSHDRQCSQGTLEKHSAAGETRSPWLRLRWLCWQIVSQDYFMGCIVFCIVFNTVILALEHHGQPQGIVDLQTYANLVLTVIFAVEMVLKLLASGFRGYVKDKFNVLDGLVVILSLGELSLESLSFPSFSVFRAFRLLRLFKLLKNFPELCNLIKIILNAVGDTGYLNLIILLYLFIAALVGMQFFGGKLVFPERGEEQPRATFHSFGYSVLTVFTILTRDDWVNVMWDAMSKTSPIACVYFIILVLCGDFLILNLFLAILIGSFGEHAERSAEGMVEEDSEEEEVAPPEPVIDTAHRHSVMVDPVEKVATMLIESPTASPRGSRRGTHLSAKDMRLGFYAQQKLGQSGASLHASIRSRSAADNSSALLSADPGHHAQLSRSSLRQTSPRAAAFRANSFAPREVSSTPVREGTCVSAHSAGNPAADRDRETTDSAGRERGRQSFCSAEEELLRLVTPGVRRAPHTPLTHHVSPSACFQTPLRMTGSELTPSHIGDACMLQDSAAEEENVVLCDQCGDEVFSRVLNRDEHNLDMHRVLCPFVRRRKMQALRCHALQLLVDQHRRLRSAAQPAAEELIGLAWEVGLLLDLSVDELLCQMRLADSPRLCPGTESSAAPSEGLALPAEPPRDVSCASGEPLRALSERSAALEKYAPLEKNTPSEKGIPSEENTEQATHSSGARLQERAVCLGSSSLVSEGPPRTLLSADSRKGEFSMLSNWAAVLKEMQRPGAETVYSAGELHAELGVVQRSIALSDSWAAVSELVARQQLVLELRLNEEVIGRALSEYRKHFTPGSFRTNGGNSLALFGPTNPIRMLAYRLVKRPDFDFFILVCICISSLMMAVENPRFESHSVMVTANFVFTAIFVAEMLCKLVAFGLLFGSSDPDPPYLQDSWNVMDGCIVIVSVLSVILQGSSLSVLKVFRTFRALRPLRVIARNRGLRMVVITLIQSLRSIGNVAVISLLVFLVFGILGVQFFAGTLHVCNDPDLRYRDSCSGWYEPEEGGWAKRKWENANKEVHYDDIRYSLMTLFEISTLEMWSEIMWNAADSVSSSEAPVRNNRPAVTVFFVVFVVVGAFFILNLFVGVVIFHYNEVKTKEDGLFFLTKEQKLWIDTQRMMLNFTPVPQMPLPPGACRQKFYHLCQSNSFEGIIGLCILLNVLVMAMEHDGMAPDFQLAMELLNFFFGGVFLLEAVMKLFGFGLGYFTDAWNRFDFFLVMVSIVGVAMLFSQDVGLPINASLLRVMRIFRIMRILRLVKGARDVRVLLETVWYSLPSIANIGGFLLLLFFIYSVLGVNLFALVKRGEGPWGLTYHANFENFPNAALLLFRIVTGENWNAVMHDTMVAPPDCGTDPETGKGNCGLDWQAPLFYISFLLMAGFVLTNLFVAIILDNFATTMEIEKSDLHLADLHFFLDIWSEFDPTACLTIPTEQLPKLLSRLGPPLGISSNTRRLEILQRNQRLGIPEHGGLVHFIETLIPLARHVMNTNWFKEMNHKDLHAQEQAWRMAFPDIMALQSLRVGQARATTAHYFASAYIAGAYRGRIARLKMREWRRAHYGDRLAWYEARLEAADGAAAARLQHGALCMASRKLGLSFPARKALASIPAAAALGIVQGLEHSHLGSFCRRGSGPAASPSQAAMSRATEYRERALAAADRAKSSARLLRGRTQSLKRGRPAAPRSPTRDSPQPEWESLADIQRADTTEGPEALSAPSAPSALPAAKVFPAPGPSGSPG
eukprot:TRINITY_DN6409_c0_g1_i2.p1 TRINITY_DN6409_c0_g1~~TRINITY_DN6409_c0_g1_i2.p1  ORF type:complete len:2273 (+),score=828.29 TRINITY_DN6409_c0_g1_i2:84-6902(+)